MSFAYRTEVATPLFRKSNSYKDSWEEMVKETVPKTDSAYELQSELIYHCSCNRDYAEAAYWAKYFKIPFKKLPTLVRDFILKGNDDDDNESDKIENSRSGCTNVSGNNTNNLNKKNNDIDGNNDDCVIDDGNNRENTNGHDGCNDAEGDTDSNTFKDCDKNQDNNQQFYRLKLDKSCIILVDTNEEYEKMIKIIRNETMIAFDAEWKPTFCSTNELALIQLATRQQIYLIDVIALKISNENWHSLAKCVLNSNDILKLGFSPQSDLLMFQKSIPGFNLSTLSMTSYLDLQDVWQKLNSVCGFQFPFDGDRQATSLSALVKLCFGRILDKSNQFSNWEKRPLRQDQIEYAALDAYCLLEIYDVIEKQIQDIGEDFNEMINSFLTDKKQKKIPKRSNYANGSSGSGVSGGNASSSVNVAASRSVGIGVGNVGNSGGSSNCNDVGNSSSNIGVDSSCNNIAGDISSSGGNNGNVYDDDSSTNVDGGDNNVGGNDSAADTLSLNKSYPIYSMNNLTIQISSAFPPRQLYRPRARLPIGPLAFEPPFGNRNPGGYNYAPPPPQQYPSYNWEANQQPNSYARQSAPMYMQPPPAQPPQMSYINYQEPPQTYHQPLQSYQQHPQTYHQHPQSYRQQQPPPPPQNYQQPLQSYQQQAQPQSYQQPLQTYQQQPPLQSYQQQQPPPPQAYQQNPQSYQQPLPPQIYQQPPQGYQQPPPNYQQPPTQSYSQPQPRQRYPKPHQHVKFICDATVRQPLAKALLDFGIDAVYAYDFEDVCFLAERENRIVLTKHRNHNQMYQENYFVMTNTVDEQVQEIHKHYFLNGPNVKLSPNVPSPVRSAFAPTRGSPLVRRAATQQRAPELATAPASIHTPPPAGVPSQNHTPTRPPLPVELHLCDNCQYDTFLMANASHLRAMVASWNMRKNQQSHFQIHDLRERLLNHLKSTNADCDDVSSDLDNQTLPPMCTNFSGKKPQITNNIQSEKQWKYITINQYHVDNLVTLNGRAIELNPLGFPNELLKKCKSYYFCGECGKCHMNFL